MRVLVLGDTGFIGKNLLNCRSTKFEFVGNSYYKKKGILFQLTDKNSIMSLLLNIKPDCVINCSGYVNHNFDFSVIEQHFLGTLNIVESCIALGVNRYIGIGTSDEYGGSKGFYKFSELDNPKPKTLYAATKLMSYKYILKRASSDLNFTWVRPFLLYGDNQDPNRIIPFTLETLSKGKSLNITSGEQNRDFLHISDFVDAIELIIDMNLKNKLLNICSGKGRSIKEVVNLIKSKVKKGRVNFGSETLRDHEELYLIGNPSTAKTLLNWTPKIHLEDWIEDFVKK